jgi:manganese/iron transport system permease protein
MTLLEAFDYPFLQRALVELLLLSVVAGVAGVHIVLRRLAFVSDTLTHTVFPGIVIAFLVGQSILLGALVAGIASAVLLSALTASRRVSQDAALAILLTSFFAVGIVLVSRTSGYTANLSVFLFGDLLSVGSRQVVETAVVAALVVLVFAALHKELLLAAFDPESARAMGYRTVALDLVLNVLIALVVVAAVRAVGTLLVIALLIVPAATAQLVTERFASMVAVAVAVGAVGGAAGLLISYEASVTHGLRFPSGATVVLALVAVFGVVSVVTTLRRQVRQRRLVVAPSGAA